MNRAILAIENHKQDSKTYIEYFTTCSVEICVAFFHNLESPAKLYSRLKRGPSQRAFRALPRFSASYKQVHFCPSLRHVATFKATEHINEKIHLPKSDMERPLVLQILSEKALHQPADPNLITYCPSMDLVALVTTDQQVFIYRLNGQRVYGATQKAGKLRVESIRWKPNGSSIPSGCFHYQKTNL